MTESPRRDDLATPPGNDPAGALVEIRLIDQDRARAIAGGHCPGEDRWVAGYPTSGDLEAVRTLLEDTRTGHAPGVFGPYEILEVATGEVVGGIGFHRPPGPDGSVEVGYSVAPCRQNRGYATEALRLIIEIAVSSGARRVEARAAPGNAASRRVLEKAGLAYCKVAGGYAHYELGLRAGRGRRLGSLRHPGAS